MKRIRPVVLAAAAVALIATPALADNGSKALGAASSDTMMALHFNAQRLNGSPLVKRVLAKLAMNPKFQEGLKEMEAKVGFNPQRDLAGLTVLVPSSVNKGGKPTIIATGTFNVKKASAEASSDKSFTKKTIAGQQAFVGKDGMGMIFSAKRVVIGPSSGLANAWSSKGGNAALSKVSNSVDRSKDVWFAASLPAKLAAELGKSNPMGKDLKNLRGSLDLASGLGLRLNLGTAKAATAESLAKLANAQIAQAKQQKNPMFAAMGLDNVLGKLNIAAKGSELAISLDLTDAEVTKLENVLGMMMMGMGRQAAPAKK